MGITPISDPRVLINGEPVVVKGSSVEYDLGEGEQNVRAASYGDGRVVSVHTENIETKTGKIKFICYPTQEQDRLISKWKRGIGTNVIELTQNFKNGDSIEILFQSMSFTNEVNRTTGSEGEVALEAKGDPAFSQ
jgi:hypothetical protein